jgi:hypothetical protein
MLRLRDRYFSHGSGLGADGDARAGMGIACAELTGDDLLDLYVTNFYLEPNTFYVNQGEMLFTDDTRRAQLFEPTLRLLGFGTQALDLDLNGSLDLMVANGHIDNFDRLPWKMRPQVFYNLGASQFQEASAQSESYSSRKC